MQSAPLADPTISRTAAWVIGTRNMQMARLRALLMPRDALMEAEGTLDNPCRMVLTEESKDLPMGLFGPNSATASRWQAAMT
jgi:L-rhamnose isomerase